MTGGCNAASHFLPETRAESAVADSARTGSVHRAGARFRDAAIIAHRARIEAGTDSLGSRLTDRLAEIGRTARLLPDNRTPL